MRGKWVLAAVSAVLLGVAAGALSRLRREPPKSAAPAPKAVEARPVSDEVSLSGTIQAQHVTSVTAQVGGGIEAFLAEVGDEVREGQVLARISNQSLDAAREQALAARDTAQSRINKLEAEIIAARLEASRAQAGAQRSRSDFEQADRVYRRQKMLHSEGATPRLVYEKSEREFQTAQNEFQSLEQLSRQAGERVTGLLQDLQASKKLLEDKNRELEEAQASLQAAEVHSPVDGIVVARRSEAGKEQQQGQEIFRIAVDLSALEVVLEPDPAMLQRIHPGQPALIVVADLLGEGITGTVKDVKGDHVIVDFVSPTPLLKPGLTAQVRIKVA